ncbi:unnamed protein product [Protopolystoma xenopodis]|uniref:Uncharacterized protein n=1 Tax=Protopolystoma xenopodis TaxID=117903 RepID=A0A3S5CI19_9PLAT|nr:unnamed protein product [Protopolystoma xenopodis]
MSVTAISILRTSPHVTILTFAFELRCLALQLPLQNYIGCVCFICLVADFKSPSLLVGVCIMCSCGTLYQSNRPPGKRRLPSSQEPGLAKMTGLVRSGLVEAHVMSLRDWELRLIA